MPSTHRVVPGHPPDVAVIRKSRLPGSLLPSEYEVRWEEIPALITALRRAYNEHYGVDTTSFNKPVDGTEGLAALQHLLTAEPQRAAPKA